MSAEIISRAMALLKTALIVRIRKLIPPSFPPCERKCVSNFDKIGNSNVFELQSNR